MVEDPDAAVDTLESSPSRTQLDPAQLQRFAGFRWRDDEVDDVMRHFAVGDAAALLQAAVVLVDGDRILARSELEAAASRLGSAVAGGCRWSPSVLADVMKHRGIASETALLAQARLIDDGDRVLDAQELQRAAVMLGRVVPANDVRGVHRRIDELASLPGVQREHLGSVDDWPLDALHLPCTSPPPALRLLVTGGVHGNEPCGPSAALLLAECVAANPTLRGRIDLTVIPLLNPRALDAATRRTPEGLDLNRAFRDGPDAPSEVRAVAGLLDQHTYDLALDLHSGKAKRNGFWVLHHGARDLMEAAMRRFDERWPVLNGNTRPYRMAVPGVGESGNDDTLKNFVARRGVPETATVEAPASVGFLDQVLGEVDLVQHILVEALARRPGSVVAGGSGTAADHG
ncbi:MAG: succinylglutamate desuccinylase/aspartoacylase family protein [Pseudomonadota bacterium]